MPDFTITDFRAVVLESLGPEEATAIGPATLDTELAELGIDSLGVLEIVNQIRGRYTTGIDDGAIGPGSTPRTAIEAVRTLMA